MKKDEESLFHSSFYVIHKIGGYRTFCVFFNANGASVYRASLARQQGIVVAGCKSSSLEIRRISLLKATRSALKIEMIFEGGQKVL